MAMDKLDRDVNELLFFSSNQWDVSGASNFGWDCAWVNQYEEVREGLPFGNVVELENLINLKTNDFI